MAQRVQKPDDEAIALVLASKHFDCFVRQAFAVVSPGATLIWNWDLSAMCHALTEVHLGLRKRQIITKPPRGLKSLIANVFLPAFELGRNPASKILSVSYGDSLIREHSDNFRRLVHSEWYRRVFPKTVAGITADRADFLGTEQGGCRHAVSMNGALTGFGADLIIIDDLMKAQEAHSEEIRTKTKRFYDDTLISRLNKKGDGRIVCIAQRLHEDDIVGHLLEKDTFHHLNLPAIAMRDEVIPLMHGKMHSRRIGDVLNPQHESREDLAQLEKDMGSRVFRQQYQQEGAPPEGDYIRWGDIQFYDTAPARADLLKVVISWDTALTEGANADYSVGTVWGYDGTAWLLLDVIRGRWNYSDLLSRVRLERERWAADAMLVEHAGSGIALLHELIRDFRCQSAAAHHAPNCQALRIDSLLPKQERIFSQVHRLYDGSAKFPREAAFMEAVRRELMAFPDGRYDDQVDSISQFLQYIALPAGMRMVKSQRSPGRARPRAKGFALR